MKDLIIGGRKFTNRFFLGTGKFASSEIMKQALAASETELVTVALTRVHEDDAEHDDILKAIDRGKVEVMLNTSGARNAAEAVKIGLIGKAAGFKWIKLEIHPDARYLLPDPDRFVGVARAGGVEHDFDLAAVDRFQDVVMFGIVLMDPGQSDRDEFGFRGGERLFENFRRGEFPGPEEKAVGELASADNEIFHSENPPVWLFP